MANFKYNKEFIENMAKEFMELLLTHEFADNCIVYFNGMRYICEYDKLNKFHYFKKDMRKFHPLDIDKNAYRNNIVSFSTEGILYDYLYDGNMPKWFSVFCENIRCMLLVSLIGSGVFARLNMIGTIGKQIIMKQKKKSTYSDGVVNQRICLVYRQLLNFGLICQKNMAIRAPVYLVLALNSIIVAKNTFCQQVPALLIRAVCLGNILKTLFANVLNILDVLTFIMIGEIWINSISKLKQLF